MKADLSLKGEPDVQAGADAPRSRAARLPDSHTVDRQHCVQSERHMMNAVPRVKYPADQADPVVALTRVRHSRAVLYRLRSGRTVSPEKYQGSHPSDAQLAMWREALKK